MYGKTCKARQYSDQMVCNKCHVAWDVNDPEPPECGQSKANRRNNMSLTLNPIKKHIVFVKLANELPFVVDECRASGRTVDFVMPTPAAIENSIERLVTGKVDVLVMNGSLVTGFRVKLTADEVDVHFVGDFDENERFQGESRLYARLLSDVLSLEYTPVEPPDAIQRTVDAAGKSRDAISHLFPASLSDARISADLEKKLRDTHELAETLLNRLSASAAREGILRDTIRLNHEMIGDNHNWPSDDLVSYNMPGNRVREANEAALNLPDDDTALKLVIAGRDSIEKIRKFNTLAGNTDDVFHIRQAAMYMGLQCEEMSEKLNNLDMPKLAETLHLAGMEFKRGLLDNKFVNVDRHAIMDDDIDIFVVTIGSLLSQGVDIHGAINEVNRANMDKVWEDGTMHRDANGKIVKPDGWIEPDLKPFVCKDDHLSNPLVVIEVHGDECDPCSPVQPDPERVWFTHGDGVE